MTDIKLFSAGIVVVRPEEGEFRFLLLRAYSHWDFPKGVVEDGESPLEGALREVKEETNLSDIAFTWGYDYIETGPYGAGKKIARYYLGETAQSEIVLPVNPELGKPEHEEFLWADYSEARTVVSGRVGSVLDWARSILNR